jgi:hypothetical protein
MAWGDDTLRFLNKILPWPAMDDDAGYGNLHWTSELEGRDEPFWAGKPFRSGGEMVGLAGYLITQPNVRDMYFCTSLQQQSVRGRNGKPQALRSIMNTMFSKVFFLEIEVKDPPKGYADEKEALLALQDFLKYASIPFPDAIVSSGSGGLNTYWIEETPLAPAAWQPLAERLRHAATTFGLRFDGQCTVDITRILRVPESYNWMTDPPNAVKLLHLA